MTTMVTTMDRTETEYETEYETDEGKPTRTLITGGDADEPFPIPDDDAFEGEETGFLAAPELHDIARALIDKHPSLRAATDGLSLAYAFKRKGGEHQGAAILGFCLKVGPAPRHLSGVDFLIWIAADTARGAMLSAFQMEAALFHELTHITRDEKGKAKVRHHDAEFFFDELDAYGTWGRDLRQAARTFAQLGLDGMGR